MSSGQFEVDCCPHCGGTSYSVRSGTKHVGMSKRNPEHPDSRYYCKDCQTGFDELATKETHTRGGNSPLGAKLAAMSADEVEEALSNARADSEGGDA
ncbi:hypothetical protein [Halorarius halobius]|uniref:hypothetical protein n=1 Tax=Halorarius halobius TaxID=2962671 RepID=UPI0020CF58C1|nr:hypothetical protein [Halorarius halobius]